MEPQTTPAAKSNALWIVVVLAALAILAFFAFANKRVAAPIDEPATGTTLDTSAGVELDSSSDDIDSIDQDYNSVDFNNLDSDI